MSNVVMPKFEVKMVLEKIKDGVVIETRETVKTLTEAQVKELLNANDK